MMRTIPSGAPARCPAYPSTEARERSVSRSRITTISQGCLLDALPDQRATWRTSSTTSCGTGSDLNERTARRVRRKETRSLAVRPFVVSLMVLSPQQRSRQCCPLRLALPSRSLLRSASRWIMFPSICSCCLRGGEQLGAEDLVVEFALPQEILMSTAGCDTAFVEDQDQVGVPHRGDPVGDDEDRAVLLAHEPVQRLLERSLRLGVHGRGAVVQNEQPRVDKKRPRYGDPLPLTAREPDAPLSDNGVVAIREPPDELTSLGRLGSSHDLLIGGVGFAEGHVFAHRAGEEARLLEDYPDLGAQ